MMAEVYRKRENITVRADLGRRIRIPALEADGELEHTILLHYGQMIRSGEAPLGAGMVQKTANEHRRFSLGDAHGPIPGFGPVGCAAR